jgi:hypothetical protein
MRGRLAVSMAMSLVCLNLGGCGGIVLAGLPLGQLSTAVGVASIAVTGKGLGEHGLDVVTGRDCRVLEALMRDEREICEEPNSLATRDDFRGVIVWLEQQGEGGRDESRNLAQASERQLAGGPVGKIARFVGLEEPIAPQWADPPVLLAELARQPAAPPPAEAEAPVAAGREPLGSLAVRIGLRREIAPAPEPAVVPAVVLAVASAPDSLRAMALRIGLRREATSLAQAGRALVERDESGPEPDFTGPLALADGEPLEIDSSFREFDQPKM